MSNHFLTFFSYSLGISRPSSPASIRHSTHSPSPVNRSPHQVTNTDQQSSPVHHRANSGPTIAISLFAEPDNSNSKYISRCNPHLMKTISSSCNRDKIGNGVFMPKIQYSDHFLLILNFHRSSDDTPWLSTYGCTSTSYDWIDM